MAGLRTASALKLGVPIVAAAGLSRDVVSPTDSAAFPAPAPRPAYSVLGHDAWTRAGIPEMRDWREAFHDAVAQGLLEDETSA